MARDPGVGAALARARADIARAEAEGAVPPPELGAQVWNVPFARPWAFGEADMYMLELRQRIPAPGSLGHREREALAEVGVSLAALSTREREVARRTSDAWAERLAGTLHHRVHHAHLAVVEGMSVVAQARVAVARGGLDEVARVEAERARVLRLIARFDGDRRRATLVLRTLLGLAPDAPVELDDDAPVETSALRFEDAVTRALTRRGVLDDARARLEGARRRLDVARVEATRPEFMVGLSAWFDPNHHDGYGATAGMTLPWLWGGGAARVRAGVAQVSAEEGEVLARERDVRGEVADAWGRVQSVAGELAVLRGEAAVAADRALEAARTGYVTGNASLFVWLDAARARLDLAMEEVDLRVELERALASLDEAVGEATPRRALEAAVSTEGGAP